MSRRTAGFVVAGLAIALLLAFGLSRYASTAPDGLEKVAADQSLDRGERPHALADGPLADYSTKGIDDPGTATGVAGVIGVAVTFAVAGGLVWLTTAAGRRRRDREAAPS
ncbi:MAG: PDGLE domain-containing protein [Acidimicrobiales bacterium]